MQLLPKRRRYSPITSIENLEIRNLLSGIMSAPIPEAESNDTLDQSMDVGFSGSVTVEGTIDRNGVDVDWYSFTLLVASEATLDSSSGTVGLYNNAPGDPQDKLNPFGHRLLAQASADGSTDATITRSLAAGTYYVAVSGKGNSYFHPLLADSGLAGETGDYTLEFLSTELSGPVSGDPLPLAIDASPLAVRIDFGGALNFIPVVELTDSQSNVVALSWTNYSSAINELQFSPNRALTTGEYTAVIKDTTGTVRMTVEVPVPELAELPMDSGNDTPANAIDLGELDELDVVQIPGIIGDDPYYDASGAAGQRPGNDVDLYHFHVRSSSTMGLQAEVFAGRFGSMLDAGISLYRQDPVSGDLIFVAGNNQSYNPALTTNNLIAPLHSDALLGAVLQAGDYYLAVSDGSNTQSPIEEQVAGNSSGIFNPGQAHSGSAGLSTGSYVLNLRLVEIAAAPEVVAVSIADQSTLSTAPTELTIRFSQFVNIAELANAAYANSSANAIAGISIQDSQGHVYIPHLTSFDPATFTARFMMVDRLPTGSYQLRVDGTQGLTNLTGTAVASNATRFTVAGPSAGTAGNPLVWTHNPQTDAPATTQELGTFFPDELVAGVKIVRPEGTGSNRNDDQVDDYSFSVLQTGRYELKFSGAGLPAGVSHQLFDHLGNVVPLTSIGGGALAFTRLTAGSYVLRVGNWPASNARSINYQIQLRALFQGDNPVPLFSGAAPAIGLRLVTAINTGGSGGSGSGGGIGGGGSNSGGGSSGGSSGGISNIGSSSASINTIDRPNDYITGQVGMRLGQLTNSNGAVIAIPTILSDVGAGLGAKLQVARSLRRISALGDGLAPSRLSEFADGPMGRSEDDRSDIETDLSAINRLSRLIDSAVAQKRNSNDSQQSPATNRSTPENETTDIADQETDLDSQGLAPAEGDGSDSDHTTTIEAPRSKLSAQINQTSPVVDVNDAHSVTDIDMAFINSELAGDHQIDTVGLQSVYLPDTVFAAGVGLLLTNAVMQGARQSESTDSRFTRLHFTSTNGLNSSRKNV